MVKIVTDSSSDLRAQEYEDLGVVPLYLVISEGNKDYRDGKDIFGRQLFEGIAEGRVFSSAQVPVYDYLKIFEDLASQGQDFIYVSISSGISGSFETANLALDTLRESYPHVKMEVVDSRGASVGQGLIVRKLAAAARSGKSFEELMELVGFLQANIRHSLIVPDLDYLARGGRLNRGQVLMGNLMGVIPLIVFDSQGNLVMWDKTRGKKKALKLFLGKALEENSELDEINLVYSDEKGLESFRRLVEELLPRAELEIWELGCAVGVHTGPGALGFAYLAENLPQDFREI